ncbi:MAG: primosomal protein N', partial [Phascolarctobacterium sp.]|nr:primosomal protein N' [Candidatus Phascolarctobacterium caballi]
RKRPLGQPLPTVEIVDMRQELAEKNFSVLSRKLSLSLKNLAKAEDQAIVLLNRRGYSTFVMCRDCGYTIKCDHCDVALVYHNAGGIMRCHYCGKTLPVPQECPSCHSRRIKFFGTGTQKAEEELGAIDGLKVLRMDQDSTQKKFAHEEILNSFKNGSYNTLIGTQMVAKGHDIPKVTLVGVLSADSSLNLPDFRAAERTFALLTQAAGRAGRGAKQGKVVFQTYEPENMILQLAAKQDYENFAVAELKNRAAYMYPPFCEMMKLTILDRDDKNAVNLAERIILFLRTSKNAENGVEILGPFPGLVPKVRDLYRFNIIVKAKDLSEVKQELLASEFKTMRNIYFDVDPVSVV